MSDVLHKSGAAAVAALGNQGNFWASPSVEPKRSYRFVLDINGLERWVVKRVKRPDFTVSEIAHEYINHKFWYPGRVDWSPINVTLVDPIKSDTTGILIGMIMGGGYRLPTTSVPTRTPNKMEATETLGAVTLYGLASGDGQDIMKQDVGYVEKWTLHNAWIKSVEFGDYSYADDSIIDLSCTIRYDFAKYEVMNGQGPDDFSKRGIGGGASTKLQNIMKNGKTLIAGS